MKPLLMCAAAAMAVLAGGTVAYAQHGHGGHGHGGHGHGGYGHGGYGHGVVHGGYGHGFGYGHGGHLHGHLHGLTLGSYYGSYGVGYPYTYGSSWSYPVVPSVVAAPVVPPVVTAPPAVVPAAGVETSTSLRPNAIPAYTGPGVTLRLPAEYPGSVYVQVDKREVEIRPGTEVVFKDKSSYLVEFDRGGDFGTSSSEVVEGVYRFAAANRGWFLVPDDSAAGGVRRNALPGEPKK